MRAWATLAGLWLAGCAIGDAVPSNAAPGLGEDSGVGSLGGDFASTGEAGTDAGDGTGETSGSGDGMPLDPSSTGPGPGDDSSSGTDTGGDSGGIADGDPGCPPGFFLAFDITDDATDQIPNTCAWPYDIWLGESDRVSLEWWSASGEHYPPKIWDLSGYDSVVASFVGCQGPTTVVPSEDGTFALNLVPGDGMIMLTVVGEDVFSGTAWYHGWLAGRHLADDEILGVDFPSWAAAWDARFTSGDRFVACYEG